MRFLQVKVREKQLLSFLCQQGWVVPYSMFQLRIRRAAQPACLTRFSTTPLGCNTLSLCHACLKYLSKAQIKEPRDLFLTLLAQASNRSAWFLGGCSGGMWTASPKHRGRLASLVASISTLSLSVSEPKHLYRRTAPLQGKKVSRLLLCTHSFSLTGFSLWHRWAMYAHKCGRPHACLLRCLLHA